MVILCSTCQKEEKECTWVKYLTYAIFFGNFKFVYNIRVLFCIPKISEVTKKNPSQAQ